MWGKCLVCQQYGNVHSLEGTPPSKSNRRSSPWKIGPFCLNHRKEKRQKLVDSGWTNVHTVGGPRD